MDPARRHPGGENGTGGCSCPSDPSRAVWIAETPRQLLCPPLARLRSLLDVTVRVDGKRDRGDECPPSGDCAGLIPLGATSWPARGADRAAAHRHNSCGQCRSAMSARRAGTISVAASERIRSSLSQRPAESFATVRRPFRRASATWSACRHRAAPSSQACSSGASARSVGLGVGVGCSRCTRSTSHQRKPASSLAARRSIAPRMHERPNCQSDSFAADGA